MQAAASAVRRVFEAIVADESAAEFAVTCSYVEIYKEVVRDLLQPSPSSSAKPGAGLAIREKSRARRVR